MPPNLSRSTEIAFLTIARLEFADIYDVGQPAGQLRQRRCGFATRFDTVQSGRDRSLVPHVDILGPPIRGRYRLQSHFQ